MNITFNANSLSSTKQAGGTTVAPGGTFAEGLVSELNPVYYTLLKAGRVYSLALANAAAMTAFTGGAAGTPLFGIYNPANSGVDMVLLQARLGVRSTGTTATTAGLNYWLTNQGGTPPTGTQAVPRQMYSGAQSGSACYCMANVANTGALASSFIAPAFSLGNVTATAGVNVTTLVDDIKGSIVVAPGNYFALGSYTALAAGAFDAALLWAEIPA